MMYYIALITCFLVSVVTGTLILPRILLIAYKKLLFDMPDERKTHAVPVPRLGGLSFLPGIFMALAFSALLLLKTDALSLSADGLCETLMLSVGAFLLYLAGIKDDIVGITWKKKLFFQLVAALLLALSGNRLTTLAGCFGIHSIPPAVGIPVTVFMTVYIINAINLIDGIDGLAAVLCSLSLCVLATLLVLDRDLYALLAVAALGVIIPFWFYNMFGNVRKEHKIFMGDSGSLMLGYLLSVLIFHLGSGGQHTEWAGRNLLLGLATLIIPLLDVIRVVAIRLLNGKSPFLPDREHLHLKLFDRGLRVGQIQLLLLSATLLFLGIVWAACALL